MGQMRHFFYRLVRTGGHWQDQGRPIGGLGGYRRPPAPAIVYLYSPSKGDGTAKRSMTRAPCGTARMSGFGHEDLQPSSSSSE